MPQVWVLSRDLPVLLFTTPMPDGRCYHAMGLLDSYVPRSEPTVWVWRCQVSARTGIRSLLSIHSTLS